MARVIREFESHRFRQFLKEASSQQLGLRVGFEGNRRCAAGAAVAGSRDVTESHRFRQIYLSGVTLLLRFGGTCAIASYPQQPGISAPR